MMKARIYLPPKHPSASVGTYQEIFLPSNEVFFKVEVKPDSGKIRDIKWTALSGRDGYKISPSKKNQTRISNLEEGEYAFLVEVTLLIKKESYQLYDTVNVKVSGKDWGPPIVEAGPDVTIFLPTNSVKLLGKAESTNPNGFIRT